MPHFERHVFICTNRREAGNPKGCCASKDSDAVRETFKKELAERGLKGRIRANAAGCLDQCGRGPAVVVYPEQTWYTVPTPDDAKEIIEQHLIGGRPVERLLMRSATERAVLDAKRQQASAGARAAKEVRSPSEMDGEYRAMVRQLLESQAYREVQAANLLGHALKFVPTLKYKLSIAEDLEEELEHFAEVARLYREVADGDVAMVVQSRLSRVPYPESWTELAMVQFLYDRAGEVHLREYVGCSYVPYREIVTKILEEEEGHESFGEEVLIDLASDERERPKLQRLFEKWLPVSLLSFGRPGTPGNRYAIQVGLKTRDSSAVMQDFINDIKPTMKRCGLRFPAASQIGVELFPEVDLSL